MTLCFTAMPELTTGLTNLLILFSALSCLLSLGGEKAPCWRGFYSLMATAAVLGIAVHCLELSSRLDLMLWLIFDVLMGAVLALFLLAICSEYLERLHRVLILAAGLLGAMTSCLMAAVLLGTSFQGQFAVAGVLGCCVLLFYFYANLALLWRWKKLRSLLGLLALLILMTGCMPWLLGGREFWLGGWLFNQAAVLHGAVALALPCFRAGLLLRK